MLRLTRGESTTVCYVGRWRETSTELKVGSTREGVLYGMTAPEGTKGNSAGEEEKGIPGADWKAKKLGFGQTEVDQ